MPERGDLPEHGGSQGTALGIFGFGDFYLAPGSWRNYPQGVSIIGLKLAHHKVSIKNTRVGEIPRLVID